MDWNRINVWTHTFYTLVHSLCIAKVSRFTDSDLLHDSIEDARTWVTPECTFQSVLLGHTSEGKKVIFRRDPNKHFTDVADQIIKMLVQDLVVILDEMMSQILAERRESAGQFPQSKIEKLKKALDKDYFWAAHGCLELIAIRNCLTHNNGYWNDKTIDIVAGFMTPPPVSGDVAKIGFPMLFLYRKAMRTFLNEVKPKRIKVG